MASVIGYLREYYRWNGDAGLSFEQQRKRICEIAREHDYRAGVGRGFLKEQLDDQATGWPALRKLIERAYENQYDLFVIPTLDGVHFNLSFLKVLAQGCGEPIYVSSGWRRAKIVGGEGTDYRERRNERGWLLTVEEEADSFLEMVSHIRQRARILASSIRGGLKEATKRGVRLGSRRRGSHRFTKAEQRKGGQISASKRRALANDSYGRWADDIWRWRHDGDSLGKIVAKLAENQALTKDGRRIGHMHVYRILKRIEKEE